MKQLFTIYAEGRSPVKKVLRGFVAARRGARSQALDRPSVASDLVAVSCDSSVQRKGLVWSSARVVRGGWHWHFCQCCVRERVDALESVGTWAFWIAVVLLVTSAGEEPLPRRRDRAGVGSGESLAVLALAKCQCHPTETIANDAAAHSRRHGHFDTCVGGVLGFGGCLRGALD